MAVKQFSSTPPPFEGRRGYDTVDTTVEGTETQTLPFIYNPCSHTKSKFTGLQLPHSFPAIQKYLCLTHTTLDTKVEEHISARVFLELS